MREFPTKSFTYAVDDPQRQQSNAFTGDTVYLRAVFMQKSTDYRLPDSAKGYLAIGTGGGNAPYIIQGEIHWNSISVKLDPQYVTGAVMDCWFYWEMPSGERSIRYPIKLSVRPTPFDSTPPPDPLPPPAQRWVGVADQGTGEVSPPVVENRIKAIEGALGKGMVYKGMFEFGFATQEDKDALTPVLMGDGRLVDGMFCWVQEMKQDYELVGGEWQVVPPTLDRVGDTWDIARFFGEFMGEEHEGSTGRIVCVSIQPLTWTLIVERVGSSFELTDGVVETQHLADGAVTNPKLANSAVAEAKIADNAVATAKIADFAVSTAKIANQAINWQKIASGAITQEGMLGNSIVTYPKLGADNRQVVDWVRLYVTAFMLVRLDDGIYKAPYYEISFDGGATWSKMTDTGGNFMLPFVGWADMLYRNPNNAPLPMDAHFYHQTPNPDTPSQSLIIRFVYDGNNLEVRLYNVDYYYDGGQVIGSQTFNNWSGNAPTDIDIHINDPAGYATFSQVKIRMAGKVGTLQ